MNRYQAVATISLARYASKIGEEGLTNLLVSHLFTELLLLPSALREPTKMGPPTLWARILTDLSTDDQSDILVVGSAAPLPSGGWEIKEIGVPVWHLSPKSKYLAGKLAQCFDWDDIALEYREPLEDEVNILWAEVLERVGSYKLLNNALTVLNTREPFIKNIVVDAIDFLVKFDEKEYDDKDI